MRVIIVGTPEGMEYSIGRDCELIDQLFEGRAYFRFDGQADKWFADGFTYIEVDKIQDRIEELEELRQQYIIEHSDVGQRSVSWGEVAGLEYNAEAAYSGTPDGKELAVLKKYQETQSTMDSTIKEEYERGQAVLSPDQPKALISA